MKRFIQTVVFAAMLAGPGMAHATFEINNVTISRVYIDPTDIVVLTNTANQCGSNFFHLPRSNTNFKEVFAFILLAYKNQTTINFAVQDSCNGDRKFISHGSVQAN